jgi:hypothetical protein
MIRFYQIGDIMLANYKLVNKILSQSNLHGSRIDRPSLVLDKLKKNLLAKSKLNKLFSIGTWHMSRYIRSASRSVSHAKT